MSILHKSYVTLVDIVIFGKYFSGKFFDLDVFSQCMNPEIRTFSVLQLKIVIK